MNTLMNKEVFNEPIKRNQNFLRIYGMNQTWVIQEKKKKSENLYYIFNFSLKEFFGVWTIFKVFIEFVTTILLFDVWVSWPRRVES